MQTQQKEKSKRKGSDISKEITTSFDVVSQGQGCSSVGRASDWHIAEVGSIPQCGKGFAPSHFSVQILLRVSVHPCMQSHAYIHLCTH